MSGSTQEGRYQWSAARQVVQHIPEVCGTQGDGTGQQGGLCGRRRGQNETVYARDHGGVCQCESSANLPQGSIERQFSHHQRRLKSLDFNLS